MNLYWLETTEQYVVVCCNRFRLAEYCQDLGATSAYQLGLASPWCRAGIVVAVSVSYPLAGGFLELLHRGRLEWSVK